MALYHMHADIIGRSAGKSAVGSVGYQFRMNVIDETTGEKLYYSKKTDKAIRVGFISPDDCAEKFCCKNKKDVVKFWNEVQKKENRKNSQFARDFDIALQSELTLEQNKKCLIQWIYDNYTKRGLCASYAIHAPHDNEDGTNNKNLHAHVMIALRKVDKNGWAEKDREGNERNFLKQVRKSWADIVNEEFKAQGIDEHIDERTLEEQGIDRQPQQHQGVVATAMERNGKTPDRTKKKNVKYYTSEPTDIELRSAINNDQDYLKLRSERHYEALREHFNRRIENEDINSSFFDSVTDEIQMNQWAEFMRCKGDRRDNLVQTVINDPSRYYHEMKTPTQCAVAQHRVRAAMDNTQDVQNYREFMQKPNIFIRACKKIGLRLKEVYQTWKENQERKASRSRSRGSSGYDEVFCGY